MKSRALNPAAHIEDREARHYQRMAKLGMGAAHTICDAANILGGVHPLMRLQAR